MQTLVNTITQKTAELIERRYIYFCIALWDKAVPLAEWLMCSLKTSKPRGWCDEILTY